MSRIGDILLRKDTFIILEWRKTFAIVVQIRIKFVFLEYSL